MEPMSPEAWWPCFQRAMRAGDGEAVLRLYEPGAAFAGPAGQTLLGHAELRRVLAPLAEAKTDFQYTIVKIVQAEDLALVHAEVGAPPAVPTPGYALEVLRRQADGCWLLALGDPFTIGARK